MLAEQGLAESIMDKLPHYHEPAQRVFSTSSFSLRRDSLRWPGQANAESAYVLEYPDWVNATALTRDGRLLFVRQYRHGVRDWVLELPGGWIKPEDADREQAIRRELREETGYVFEHVEPLLALSPNPGTHDNRLHTFLATGGEPVGAPQPDADEHIQVLSLSLDEVQARLLEGSLLDNGHLSCLLLGLLRLGRLRFDLPQGETP